MSELHELTYQYPKQSTPNIQELISAKKEFADLALPRDIETLASRGDLYKHQQFGVLYANIYDHIFVNHEPGTGKTAYGWAIGESFRKNEQLSPMEAYSTGVCNWIRKMLILVPGNNVETSWKSSFHKHSDLKHIPSFYSIEHMGTFYNKFFDNGILRPNADELIKAELDNTAIYIDEVHEMLTRSQKEKKGLDDKEDFYFEENITKQNPEIPTEDDKRKRYNFLKRAFAISSNIKLFLATGTPIIASPIELAYIINLFPGGKPIVTEKISNEPIWYEHTTVREIENSIKESVAGKISHVTNKKRDALIVWPPESEKIMVKGSKEFYNVVKYKMSAKQTELYEKSFSTAGEFNTGPLQASEYASEEKITKRRGKSKEEKKIVPSIQTIYEHGIKFKHLKDIIKARKGIKFIISSWLEAGIDRIEQILINELGMESVGGGIGRPGFPTSKKPRYVVLKSGQVFTERLKFVNDPRNVMGEFIEVVVTSNVGSISISIHNVQTYIVLGPAKHQSQEKQRISRILRPKSHEDLIAYKKKLLQNKIDKNEPITPEDEDLTIKIMAYYMAAIPSKSNLESIDLKTYKNNIEKEKPLEIVRTAINRLAVDAQINYERNQLNCVYDDSADCKYGFSDPKPQGGLGSDRSTYNLLHGRNETEPLIRELVDTLMHELSVDINEFWERKYRSIPIIPFYRTLHKIIRSNTLILTTTGEQCILKMIGNNVVITTNNNINSSIYPTIHSIYRSTQTIATYFEDLDFKTVEDLAKYLDIPSTKGNDLVNEKISIIERILLKGNEDNNKPFYEYVMKRYSHGKVFEDQGKLRKGGLYIFQIKKPIGYIRELTKAESDAKRIKMAENLPDYDGEDGEDVLLHLFWAQKALNNNSKFNTFIYHINASTISIFDSKYNKFVTLTMGTADQLAYGTIISRIIKKKYENYMINMRDRKNNYTKKKKQHISKINDLLIESKKTSKNYIKDFTDKVDDKIRKKELEKNPGEIWGAYFDPEMMFRINDARKEVPATKENKKSKNKESRTKQFQSYEIYEYCDFAVFLGINDGIYDGSENIDIPDIEASSGIDWLNEIERLAQVKAGVTSKGIQKEVTLGKKNIDDNQLKAIRYIKKERFEYYASPDAIYDGMLLYILFQLHIGNNKPSKLVKRDFAEKMERFLHDTDAFYIF